MPGRTHSKRIENVFRTDADFVIGITFNDGILYGVIFLLS